MKIFDILTENQEMTEAPMGTFSKLGNKIASTFGSGKATGKLETGKVANELRKEFDVYLGRNGEEATPETAIEFLKSKGYPTTKAQQASGVAPRGPVPAGDNSTSQSSQHPHLRQPLTN